MFEVRPHHGRVSASPFSQPSDTPSVWAGTPCVSTIRWRAFGWCPRLGCRESRRHARVGTSHPLPFLSRPCAHTQVSKASSELMSYCEQHARNDPLVVGVPASENPFKDKKPCIIL